MPARARAGWRRRALDLREIPRQRSRGRGDRRLLRQCRGSRLAAGAALCGARLSHAAVSLARAARTRVRTADRLGTRAGDGVPGHLVGGAALQGADRTRSVAGPRATARRTLAT